MLGAEVLDDRAGERGADTGHAPAEPERDALGETGRVGVEGLDGELPAVARVPLVRSRDDKAVPRGDVAERTAKRQRLAAALAEHG